LRSFWEWRLKESPELATQIGVHTYDNSLDDHSLGAYAKRQKLVKNPNWWRQTSWLYTGTQHTGVECGTTENKS